MPVIRLEDGDQFEDKPVTPGRYGLTINKAENRDSKAGNPMLVVTWLIDGEKEAPPITEFMVIPREGDEHYRLHMRTLTRFAAGIGLDEFDPEDPDTVADLAGRTTEQYLDKEVGDDNVERNRIRWPRVGK